MVAPGLIVFAVAGYFSCAISLPPLVLQIQQRNLPSSVLILSIVTVNITWATNALIWHSADYTQWWDGRVFCDIQIRVHIAVQIAVLGAASCIFRQLSLVFHPSLRLPTRAQKRWTKFIEFTFCIGIPILRMTTVYVVQPDRYRILRMIGCALYVDTSWPTYVLVYSWIPILSIHGLYYAAITTIRMVHHRRNTRSILGQGQNPRNESRVMKLYWFGLVLFLTFVPLQIYGLYYTVPRHLESYSWSRIHPPDWSDRIFFSPFTQAYRSGIAIRWISILYSIAIALLVGLAPDAVASYKGWLAQFHVWRKRLSNRKSTPILPSSNLPIEHESSTRLQVMGRHELEALSVIRRDQEVV